MNVLLVDDGTRFGGLGSTRYGFPVSGCAWCCRTVVGGRRHSAGE